jgi:5-formyltetrahydrofolate cyclo-ligase
VKLLRQQIKNQLQNLTKEFCDDATQKITAKISTSEIFNCSKNIACYIPIDNEINTRPIMEKIWQQNKNCFLPTLDAQKKYYLNFLRFNKQDKLIASNKYNIPEPEFHKNKIIMPQNLDLVIVPLLGFNENFFRLGRGAGCYDRTFSFKQQNPKTKPYLLGIAYSWQKLDFKPQPWDIAMDEVYYSC